MYLDCWQADRRLHMKTWALGSSSSVKFGFWNPLSLLGLCSAHSSLLPWALQWFYLISCQKLLLSGGISTTLTSSCRHPSLEQTPPVLSSLGSAGYLAWQAHAWGQQGWFLIFLWRAWILLSVVLTVNRDGQIMFKLFVSKIGNLKLFQNDHFALCGKLKYYFPGWRCMHKVGAYTSSIDLNLRRSGD